MKLYLVRHGDYITNESNQDELSEKGINEIKELANFLMPLHIRVANIIHSGKIRAQQTAELLSSGVACDQPLQARQGLNPNDAVTSFANEMMYENDDMFVIGHLPFISRLVGQLVVSNENKDIVVFHTGTIVCLESLDPTRWIIQWVWNSAFMPKNF